MPPRYRKHGEKVYPLSRAYENGYFARVQCHWCHTKRIYRPDDLKKLLGDLECDEVAERMRCENCGHNDCIRLEFWYPYGAEKEGMVVRRLVEIKTIKRPIWRDEPV